MTRDDVYLAAFYLCGIAALYLLSRMIRRDD